MGLECAMVSQLSHLFTTLVELKPICDTVDIRTLSTCRHQLFLHSSIRLLFGDDRHGPERGLCLAGLRLLFMEALEGWYSPSSKARPRMKH